ncbi:hypothetical protein PAXRUDRAFT_834736 [Paxillus rubicundulus Ve08.2h10]|uniref:Uncharacterized protein n=1 Tax=Paxillus rubicundulus Ve08.2h10 TaxID=930991 RepID=A0A0D0DBR4_9AGAM|nr:hypothetical protein PAXRUDRAFT_834736 [Paxillus rubicundulus Ve08.2h10]
MAQEQNAPLPAAGKTSFITSILQHLGLLAPAPIAHEASTRDHFVRMYVVISKVILLGRGKIESGNYLCCRVDGGSRTTWRE